MRKCDLRHELYDNSSESMNRMYILIVSYREAVWTCFFYGNKTGENIETTALKGNEYSYNYKYPVGSEEGKKEIGTTEF